MKGGKRIDPLISRTSRITTERRILGAGLVTGKCLSFAPVRKLAFHSGLKAGCTFCHGRSFRKTNSVSHLKRGSASLSGVGSSRGDFIG